MAACHYTPPFRYFYFRGDTETGVIIRRSSFSTYVCTPETSAEIQKNLEEGFALVELGLTGRAVLNRNGTSRASEVSVGLTEAIRQAIVRAGL